MNLKSLNKKTKNAKAKIDAIPGQLSFSLSGALSELSGVWNGELEGLQQELEKSIREYSEELGRAEQVVSKTHQELKAADEALLQALGLDSEIAPQKTSKGKAAGASKKKKEKEEGNAFTQSLKGIGDGAAKGVYETGKHPIRTYNAVKDGVVTAVDEKLIHGDAYSRSHFFSYAGTEIGLAALGDKGAGLAVKGAGAVSKTAKGMKEVHKATVKQKVPALKPATAGVAGRLPVNTLETGYLGRFLQNAKDMYWNSSEVTGNNVLYKKEGLLPTSADIGKSSLLAPGGGLMAHEGKKKGHLIERHIDKTDEQLLQRLKEDKKIPSSSSFKDRATAERVANIVLNDSKNIDKIQKWLSNPHSRPTLALKYKGDGEILGRSIARNSELAEDVTKARIVLKKGKNGSFIVTGYPEK